MRRSIARWLRRVALRIDKVPQRAGPIVTDNDREQTKAMKSIAKELHANTQAIRTGQDARAFQRDLRAFSDDESNPLAEGMPVRIESDGTGGNTKVMVGEVPISNAIRATWQVGVGHIARALVEFDQVAADVTGEMVDHG